jgi:hypothetical protein
MAGLTTKCLTRNTGTRRLTGRIGDKHFVVSRIGSKMETRNKVESIPSNRSRRIEIRKVSVIPRMGVVINNTLCAQFSG